MSGPERSKLSKMSRLDEQKNKERNGNGEETSEGTSTLKDQLLYCTHATEVRDFLTLLVHFVLILTRGRIH